MAFAMTNTKTVRAFVETRRFVTISFPSMAVVQVDGVVENEAGDIVSTTSEVHSVPVAELSAFTTGETKVATRRRPMILDAEQRAILVSRGLRTGITLMANHIRNLEQARPSDYMAKLAKADPADIVFINYNDGTMADINGVLTNTAVIFGYNNGFLHNGAYDLVKAVEILSARDDFEFLDDRGVVTADRAIRSIPSYNSEDGRDMYISGTWRSNEFSDYATMEDYKRVFDEDLLGLRAGGAARYDNFYDGV